MSSGVAPAMESACVISPALSMDLISVTVFSMDAIRSSSKDGCGGGGGVGSAVRSGICSRGGG